LGAGHCHFINNISAAEKHAVDLHDGLAGFAAADVIPHVMSCVSLDDLPDDRFDIVFSSNLFEHLTAAELEATLSETRRVLRNRGRLITMQPNFKYCYREYFDDYTHKQAFTHVGMKDLLHAHGFRPVHVRPRFLPFSMKSRLPKSGFLVRLYLHCPVKPLAGQFLIVAECDERRGTGVDDVAQ
jgi:SAM-dependent methyltransferase